MSWLVIMLTPVVVFSVAAALVPPPGPPPRWRVRLAALLERLARRLRGSKPPPPDPFESLRLQMRLGVVTSQLRALEDDDQVYAKAHRLKATRAAYDDLLEEACRLAGVPPHPEGHRGESERLREEVELTSRGWSW